MVKGAVMPAYDFPRFLAQINDKLVHGAEFFLLGLVAWRAFRQSLRPQIQKNAAAMVLTYGFFMAALTEGLQFGSSTRVPSWADFGADILGILSAFLFLGLKLRMEHGKNA